MPVKCRLRRPRKKWPKFRNCNRNMAIKSTHSLITIFCSLYENIWPHIVVYFFCIMAPTLIVLRFKMTVKRLTLCNRFWRDSAAVVHTAQQLSPLDGTCTCTYLCLQSGEASYPENVTASSHVIKRFILVLIRWSNVHLDVLGRSTMLRFAGDGDFRNRNANHQLHTCAMSMSMSDCIAHPSAANS